MFSYEVNDIRTTLNFFNCILNHRRKNRGAKNNECSYDGPKKIAFRPIEVFRIALRGNKKKTDIDKKEHENGERNFSNYFKYRRKKFRDSIIFKGVFKRSTTSYRLILRRITTTTGRRILTLSKYKRR